MTLGDLQIVRIDQIVPRAAGPHGRVVHVIVEPIGVLLRLPLAESEILQRSPHVEEPNEAFVASFAALDFLGVRIEDDLLDEEQQLVGEHRLKSIPFGEVDIDLQNVDHPIVVLEFSQQRR